MHIDPVCMHGYHGKKTGQKEVEELGCEVLQGEQEIDPSTRAWGLAWRMAASAGQQSSAGPRKTKAKLVLQSMFLQSKAKQKNLLRGTQHMWGGDPSQSTLKEAQARASQQNWTCAPKGDSFCPWKQGISVKRESCGHSQWGLSQVCPALRTWARISQLPTSEPHVKLHL